MKKTLTYVKSILIPIILGGAFGLAIGGSILMLGAAFTGVIFGAGATFLGATALQSFAVGALAFNFTAYMIAPIFGINMQGIEFENPNKNLPYEPPEYIYSSNLQSQ